jgi:hypothetical protein
MYDVRWMILASSRLDFVDAKQLLGDFVFRGTVLVPYRQGMRSCTGRNRRRDRGERRELAHYSGSDCFATWVAHILQPLQLIYSGHTKIYRN